MKEKIKIPKGLYKCPKCGEYRGKVREKDLPQLRHLPEDTPTPDETSHGSGYIEVSCLCRGMVCLKCGRKVHRPISNRYDPENGEIQHFPWFHGYCEATNTTEERQPRKNWKRQGERSKRKLK